MYKCNISFILVLVLLFGCNTTGGTIGGLMPAPKFTKGKIENDTYFSKDNDFSVRMPHKKGSSEYLYLQIKEQYYSQSGAYISFGPAAGDLSIYRLEVGKKLSEDSNDFDIDSAIDIIIDSYITQLSSYGSTPKITSKDKINFNGNEAYQLKLTQELPNEVLTHDAVIVDYRTMSVIFWVQKSSVGGSQSLMSVTEFAESFEILDI